MCIRDSTRIAAVSLRNVTKTFGAVVANEKVNLDIYKGEILALLGENGSGKTTLMNMLSGIYFPDEGQIFINGKEEIIKSPKEMCIRDRLKIEVTVNIIPFIYMIPDFANACLNVLLFIPFGFFLPTLWEKFRNVKSTILVGLLTTLFVEISQLFTGRATDIDDVITNIFGTIIGYYIAYWFTKGRCV